jgi:hypothetical protein
VEIPLVLNEPRDGYALDRNAVMRIGGDHCVAMAVILRDGQQRLEICKDGVIDCDHVRPERENMLATSLTVTWFPVIRLVKVNAPACCCPVA